MESNWEKLGHLRFSKQGNAVLLNCQYSGPLGIHVLSKILYVQVASFASATRAWLTLASLAPSVGHGDIGVVFLASLASAVLLMQPHKLRY